jgi:hypothetical protein
MSSGPIASVILAFLIVGCSSSSNTGVTRSNDTDAGDDAQNARNDEGGTPGRDATSPVNDTGTSSEAATTEAGGEDGATTVMTGDSGFVTVVCDEEAAGICQTTAVPPSAEPGWRGGCTNQGGTSGPCPTSNRVGCCEAGSTQYCYFSPSFTVASAQQDCSAQDGTWSTGI